MSDPLVLMTLEPVCKLHRGKAVGPKLARHLVESLRCLHRELGDRVDAVPVHEVERDRSEHAHGFNRLGHALEVLAHPERPGEGRDDDPTS